jgi:hypothetical protein
MNSTCLVCTVEYFYILYAMQTDPFLSALDEFLLWMRTFQTGKTLLMRTLDCFRALYGSRDLDFALRAKEVYYFMERLAY